MVPQAKIDEVRRLLAEGKKHREVARLADVSRGTVAGVASGKRRDYCNLPHVGEEATGPIVRCPGCGGRIFAPCILCRIRKQNIADRSARRRTAGRSDRIPAEDRRRNDPTFGG